MEAPVISSDVLALYAADAAQELAKLEIGTVDVLVGHVGAPPAKQ
jgi:hypothetical protein